MPAARTKAPASAGAPRTVIVVDRPGAPQSQIFVGELGIESAAPDRFAARVMNLIFGGSFNSRLNINLRTEHGWSYGAFSFFQEHRQAGPFISESGVMADGMFRLNLAYARHFNRRHASRGHVQFKRYGAKRIDDDSQLLTAHKYVARNPVEAALCNSPSDWPWSSYPGTVGAAEPSTFVDASRVLGSFGDSRELSIARLRRFVEES